MARGKKYSQLELQAKHTIACAKEEFGTKIQGYLINWSIATDDGGKFNTKTTNLLTSVIQSVIIIYESWRFSTICHG